MGFGSGKSRFGLFVMDLGWESLNLDLCGGIWVRKVQIWVFEMRFGSERFKIGVFVMGFGSGKSKLGSLGWDLGQKGVKLGVL